MKFLFVPLVVLLMFSPNFECATPTTKNNNMAGGAPDRTAALEAGLASLTETVTRLQTNTQTNVTILQATDHSLQAAQDLAVADLTTKLSALETTTKANLAAAVLLLTNNMNAIQTSLQDSQTSAVNAINAQLTTMQAKQASDVAALYAELAKLSLAIEGVKTGLGNTDAAVLALGKEQSETALKVKNIPLDSMLQRIGDLEDNVETNTGDIISVKREVQELTNSANDQISALDGRMGAAESEILSLKSAKGALEDADKLLQSNIDAVSAAATAVDTRVTNLPILAMQTQINQVQAKSDQTAEDAKQLPGIQTAITNLRTDITAAQANIVALQTSMQTATTNITTLQTTVSAAGLAITGLQQTVGGLSGQLNALQQQVKEKIDSGASDAQGWKAATDALAASLGSVQTDVTALKGVVNSGAIKANSVTLGDWTITGGNGNSLDFVGSKRTATLSKIGVAGEIKTGA